VKPRAVVIGASAGGIAAMRELVAQLPRSFPVPILLVLHIKGRVNADYSRLFGDPAPLGAKEADDKEVPIAGRIYVAPAGYHLLVETDGSLSLSIDPLVNFSRPSIDVLFETAAIAHGPDLAGVLLTGANGDGAAGLAAIRQRGGRVAVQDPASAEASAMPEAALKALKARPDCVGRPLVLGAWLADLCAEAPGARDAAGGMVGR
jgi:two-component system chemotaxis response regulator CheB